MRLSVRGIENKGGVVGGVDISIGRQSPAATIYYAQFPLFYNDSDSDSR
jgi:hypothetical protein